MSVDLLVVVAVVLFPVLAPLHDLPDLGIGTRRHAQGKQEGEDGSRSHFKSLIKVVVFQQQLLQLFPIFSVALDVEQRLYA